MSKPLTAKPGHTPRKRAVESDLHSVILTGETRIRQETDAWGALKRYDAIVPITAQRRSFLIDSALAVALFATSVISLAALPGFGDTRPIDAFGIGLIAAETLTLAWRRRFPVVVLTVVIGAFAVDRALNYPSSWAFFGIAIAIYTIGAELSSRRSAIIGGVAIAVVVLWTIMGALTTDLPAAVIVTIFGFMMFPFVLGREARRREQRALGYEARAIKAEFDRELRAAEAVREEQTRIARELHDVVAHEVTVMTIQAAAANRVLDESPTDARTAIQTVEESGHRALTEMRRLLGLLRSGSEAELGPQPGLHDLETLVEQFADAGVNVCLSIEGVARPLPVGVEVNAYRIIQESLTNTVKHGGPGAKAEVLVRFGTAELTVEVDDDGRGAAEGLSVNGSGQGIVGMRERVALLDGTFGAEPRPGGGFRVRAVIPIEAEWRGAS
jgi:signal transduction histidine kinase